MAAPTDTLNKPANFLDRLREAVDRLNTQQKLALMVSLAALVAVIVGTVLWAKQPDYKVLFSNLSEKDGGAIVALLEQQNIPHQFSESSGAILVPANRVHEVRLKMAQQGLPRGAVGFELMENSKIGLSQYAEQVNFQRALEGELARTIQSIGAVQAARVHLAIPKPSVFVQDKQFPTASVLLTLYPGRALDGAQIAGITHLVAASVPQLPAANVTVLDQNGTLLSQLKSALSEAGLDQSQIKYIREVENSIIRRIDDILKPILGSENYKVQIAADVDFSQTEQTSETYDPNETPGKKTIRSTNTSETASVSTPTGGVPGALTNQPPVPATAPITNPPTGAATTGAKPGEPGRIDVGGVSAPLTGVAPPISSSRSTTTNIEVNKTILHTKQSMGKIRRLSAAVVLNHRKETGKDGKPAVKALPEAEIKQINDLVREAMGFTKERGDTLSIASSPFTVVEKTEVVIPLWKDPDNQAFAKEILKYLVLLGIVAFLWFKIIQPLVKTMFPPPPPSEEAERVAALGEDGALDEQVEVNNYAAKIQKARDLAQSDPKAVANILKEWMSANA